jgi:hypothetical protein
MRVAAAFGSSRPGRSVPFEDIFQGLQPRRAVVGHVPSISCKRWADASRNPRRLPLNIFSGNTMRLRWYASLAESARKPSIPNACLGALVELSAGAQVHVVISSLMPRSR